jgi:hypothetical protein
LFGAIASPLELDELELLLDKALPEELLLLLLLDELELLLLPLLPPLPPVLPDVSAPRSGRQPPPEPTATQPRARSATLEAKMLGAEKFIARLLDHRRQPGVNAAFR